MKRLIKHSLLGLAAALLVQFPTHWTAPLSAYAEDETGADEEASLTGICGENLTYEWTTVEVTLKGSTVTVPNG